MKFKKSFFSTLLLFAFAASTFASTPTFDESTTTANALNEIKTLVNKIDFDFAALNQKTVKVHFMINTSNEVVVLRTDSKEADRIIKHGLNYKSLKNKDLKVNKVYILPISFKAQNFG